MNVEITHLEAWKASYWDEDVAPREAWFVTCPDHPHLGICAGEPWGYAQERHALTTRTRHIRAYHRPKAAE